MKFFLGIRIPNELEETCERYRRAFKAPKTITHITVVPPFAWDKSAQDLLKLLEMSLTEVQPFEVSGAGIGSFGNRVLFVNVTLSPELDTMQKTLTLGLKNEGISVDSRPYHPHITLATRLDSKHFTKFKEALGDFSPEYSFPFSHLSVFQFTDAGRWDEWQKVPLGDSL